MSTKTIEAEVVEWIAQHLRVTDERGRRQLLRNGDLRESKLVTGVGEVSIQEPRVHDRRPKKAVMLQQQAVAAVSVGNQARRGR